MSSQGLFPPAGGVELQGSLTARRSLLEILIFVVLLSAVVPLAFAGDSDSSDDAIAPAPEAALMLDTGFRDLYKLDFEGARAQFRDYQKEQPADPLGKAAEAATYLYEQFNEKGVLTSKFFLDDDKFLGGVDGPASRNHNAAFLRTTPKRCSPSPWRTAWNRITTRSSKRNNFRL
jgi:hypothetical protein